MSGKIQTVCGEISSDTLGITLCHEHISLNIGFKLLSRLPSVPNPAIVEEIQRASTEPLGLKNLWIVKRYNEISSDNLLLDDISLAVEELSYFKKMGGSTMIELSNNGMGRSPHALREISLATGLNLIASTGYYTENSHPKSVRRATIDDLADEMVHDIQVGIGQSDVKAGVIGEIGTSTFITAQEEKVLRGACRAQLRTNVALSIHLANIKGSEAEKITQIVEQEGVDLNKLILGHMDVSYSYLDNLERLLRLAQKGAYLEFDTFSLESYDFDRNVVFPRDVDRVKCIKKLIEHGVKERILISQDIDMKIRLKRWGGQGYDHILRNVIPIFKIFGLSDDDVKQILIDNPSRVLAC